MSATSRHDSGVTSWPVVSVVVAAYNGERHIGETLRAVLAQTYRSTELIVVDDGSTDGTLAAVQAIAPGARVIKKANGGVSSARNAGAAAAQGSFICFLDQDDIWSVHHLQRHMQAMRDRPECGAVVSPYLHWYPDMDNDVTPSALWGPAQPLTVDAEFTGWVFHQFMRDCWALTSATTVRMSAFRAAGGFDEQRPYAEDWDLWLRLSRMTKFAKVCWPAVLYRQHRSQGSRVARPVDHRTMLLLEAAKNYGLASRDGRAVSSREFEHLIARYQFEFGQHHLQFGQRRLAIQALLQAWFRAPLQFRYLAWVVVALSGYRPGP